MLDFFIGRCPDAFHTGYFADMAEPLVLLTIIHDSLSPRFTDAGECLQQPGLGTVQVVPPADCSKALKESPEVSE